MYQLVFTGKIKKQLKKMARSGRYDIKQFHGVVDMLQAGRKLSAKYHDHALHGQLQDYRECHVAPDWLLVYRIVDDLLIIELLQTGSHAELFG